jgi:integrase
MSLKLKPVSQAAGTKLYIVGSLNGVRVNRSTGFGPKQKALANAQLRALESEIVLSSTKPDKTASQEQELSHWLTVYLSKGQGVGVTTRKYVEAFVAKYPTTSIEDIMPIDVIRYVTTPAKSQSTIRREITAIQGFLNYIRDGIMLPPLRIRKPEEAKPKDTRFTEAERDHMLSVCEDIEPWFIPHMTFLFYTGARRSELCRLRWCDVEADTSGNSVVVLRSRKGRTGRTVERRIPVHPMLAPILKAMRMLRRPKPESFVFLTCTGIPFETPAGINKAFDKVAAAAGLPHLTPHDVRRTFASTLLEREVSDHLITNMLGHVDKRMLKVYAVVDDALRMSAINKISSPSGA